MTVLEAGLFERSAASTELYIGGLGVLLAIIAFLFSPGAPLAPASLASSAMRRVWLAASSGLVFLIGAAAALAGLAVNEPTPVLAGIVAGAILVLALVLISLVSAHAFKRLPWRGIGLAVAALLFTAAALWISVEVEREQGPPDIGTAEYATVPADPQGPEGLPASRLAIVVCRGGGEAAAGCGPATPGAEVFTLRSLHHEDREASADNWDYSFRADGGDLRFLYRKNPGQSSHWGFVRGKTDQNVEFSENKVYGLEGFGETALARNVLEVQADDQGMRWARRGGLATSTRVTSSPFGPIPNSLGDWLLVLVVVAVVLGIPVALAVLWRRSRPATLRR